MVKSLSLAAAALCSLPLCAETVELAGPDGRLKVTVDCPAAGRPTYSVLYDGVTVIEPSPLGFTADTGDYTDSLTVASFALDTVTTAYSIPHTKKKDVARTYCGGRISLENSRGGAFDIEMMVSDHDLAFRYLVPVQEGYRSIRILDEATSFALPTDSRSYLSPQCDPMTGWKRTKPSYEERYRPDAPLDAPSEYGHGYTFPCLFHTPAHNWVLISETGVDSRYCASRLGEWRDGRYKIEFPMPEENNGNGTSQPAFALPGATPWRTVTIGSDLAPIVESTVTWDVVEPRFSTAHYYPSGRGTWSWILWQDESINFDDQIKFIDLAADMGYEYTLIDCAWDTNIGREGMKRLGEYAAAKGVTLFVWYSSSGYWNDIVQSPTDIMDNAILRKKEMKWLNSIGAKGIKVDFFGGDKQETMRLYEEILSDADDHGLMVIFHGCTLPRGWERMYPNYVGSEAVLASENMVFQQAFCDEEAATATLHPFIRNAVGCMEYGGTFLNRRLNRTNDGGSVRRTGDAFELALAVIYQNPIQNFALAPNNLSDAPRACIDFLKAVPTEWDDTRYVDGIPGKYAVIARRCGATWYIGAINALSVPLDLELDLSFAGGREAKVIADAPGGIVTADSRTLSPEGTLPITLLPSSGAVITLGVISQN